MRLLLDENFNHLILGGLKLRIPNLDYVIAQKTALKGVEDPDLLEWAAVEDRLLVTHDSKTIPKFAYERMKAGKPLPGVIVIPQDFPVGPAIEELMAILLCSEQSEYENQVVYVPL
jgi:predicted nuclease of predicted toxin-antitoxin system